MTETFIVTGMDSEKITVSLYKSEANSDKRFSHIEVTNSNNLKIAVGTLVRIGFPRGFEFIQGILALIFPILFGLAGMLLTPKILESFKTQRMENARFLITTAFFLTAAIVTRILTRSYHTVIKPSITAIVENTRA